MRSKIIYLLTGIFILAAFTQCRESVTITSDDNPDLPEPSLIAPEDNSKQPTAVSFDWESVEDAEAYEIRLASDEEFSSMLVNNTTDSAGFDIQGLPYDSTLYWQVRSTTEEESGPWSEAWQFTTMQQPDNSEPISTELKSPNDGATDRPTDVELSWTTVASATSYDLQVATDQNFNSLIVNQEVEATSYQTSGLANQETYFWRVEPNVPDEETTWSEVYDFTTQREQDQQTPAVTLVSPSDGATDLSTSPTLEWEEISGISEYQVQLATGSSFSSPVVDETVTDLSFNASGLEYDQRYFWRVQATGDSNSENWSNVREFQTESESTDPPPNNDAFVTADNGDFVVDGEVFRFVGTNAYHLPTYEQINPSIVDQTLDAFQEAGVRVVRVWGFYDGQPQYSDDITLQPNPGEYNESDLQHLDNLIAKGKEHNIRFILTLVNYWDALGGIGQYNEWDGNAGGGMSHFINDPDTQQWFRDYITMLTNRVNTVTGVAYKNEPAIFSWEIINEGRLPGGDPAELRDWYQEIAQHIKSEDPNHMVSTGEEGFDNGAPSEYSVDQYSNTYPINAGEGSSYIENTSIPEIDYGTAHWYPENWGLSPTDFDAQHAWLSDHAQIAEDLGKPFVLGEYGDDNGWGDSEQLAMYEDFWNHAESIQMDGSLLWQFTPTYVKCYEFGGNICWPGGRQDEALYNSYRNHAQTMNNSN